VGRKMSETTVEQTPLWRVNAEKAIVAARRRQTRVNVRRSSPHVQHIQSMAMRSNSIRSRYIRHGLGKNIRASRLWNVSLDHLEQQY